MLYTVLYLHWVPVYNLVEFKILLIAFNALNDLAPKYMTDLLQPESSRMLPYATKDLLVVLATNLVKHLFYCTGPKLWNELPNHIHNSKEYI